jgi:AcrR family transcriptional regulator
MTDSAAALKPVLEMPAPEGLVLKRPRGRPRSVKAEAAIVEATADLMDGGRFADITAEAIARKAGVSKATLYKWWPNKTHLVLDVLRQKVGEAEALPDTGRALDDLVIALQGFVRLYKGTAYGSILRDLMAEGMSEPEVMAAFNARFFVRRREGWHAIWRRGVERGELRADIDPQLGLDLLYGPAFMRLMSGASPLTEGDAEAMVHAVFAGVAK